MRLSPRISALIGHFREEIGVLKSRERFSFWPYFLIAQGLLLASLPMTGCGGPEEPDPAVAKVVRSRIKRIADSADDPAPSAKGKSKAKGGARPKAE
jgi:hypothetical protein